MDDAGVTNSASLYASGLPVAQEMPEAVTAVPPVVSRRTLTTIATSPASHQIADAPSAISTIQKPSCISDIEYEKRGRLPHPEWLRRGFQEVVANCGLLDFLFTASIYLGAKAALVTCPYSDHLPILLTPVVVVQHPRCKRFCFDNIRLREDVCREIIEQSWVTTMGLGIHERVESGARRSIGDGRITNNGFDPWLAIADSPFVSTELHESIHNVPVCSLFADDGSGWDVECVKDCV
nr:uncharacterized protein LOC109155728 [Ipomoea batatas]